jgi:general secretion pathway protein K
MSSPIRSPRDHGFILLVVLWMAALFALTATAFVKAVQAHLRSTTVQIQSSRAELLADSGLALAALDLIEAQGAGRRRKFPADGVPISCMLDEGQLTISVQDAGGRINLNTAGDRLLQALFAGLGASREAAAAYSTAIVNFRAPAVEPQRGGTGTPGEQAAGRPLGPKHAPLDTLEELQQIEGLDAAIITAMRPHVTIHSGTAGLDPQVTPETLIELLARGYESLGTQSATAAAGSRLPAEFVVASTQRTYIVQVQGTLPAGASYVREAVIELAPNRNSLPTYKVWKRSIGSPLAAAKVTASGPC